MIYQDNFNFKVKGLFGYHEVKDAYISYKLLEACCLADYQRINGKNSYPEWNLQEQGEPWSLEVKENHAKITNDSLAKKGRKKKE